MGKARYPDLQGDFGETDQSGLEREGGETPEICMSLFWGSEPLPVLTLGWSRVIGRSHRFVLLAEAEWGSYHL